MDVGVARAIIDLIGSTIEFDEEGAGWDENAFKAALDYLSEPIRRVLMSERCGVWCGVIGILLGCVLKADSKTLQTQSKSATLQIVLTLQLLC